MPTIYNKNEYADMLAVFNEVGRSSLKASRLYLLRYPQRRQPSRATYKNIDKCLREKGNIEHLLIFKCLSYNICIGILS